MEQPRDSIPQNSQDRQVTSAEHPQVARPTALPVSVNHIPAQLRTLPQWVCWQYEYQPKRSPEKPWTKVPINPQTGKHASSTNPKTWGTFEEALRHYQKLGLDGICVVVTDRDDL